MNNQKTGAFIKTERKRLKLTQCELGRKFSVTDKAVSKWERGLTYPDVEILKKMAILFECTMQEIVNGERETSDVPFTSQSAFSVCATNADTVGTEGEDAMTSQRHKPGKCLVIANMPSDFTSVLEACGVDITIKTQAEALNENISDYDVYYVCCQKILDPRLRVRLEEENAKGKRLFAEALNSWGGIYCAEPENTVRSRLVVAVNETEEGIPGLTAGDLLDDQSNRVMQPWYPVPGLKPILVYHDHIIAHRHWNADIEEILKNSRLGLFMLGETVMMCTFELHNFNRARFSPRKSWERLIGYLAHWLTGSYPTFMPKPIAFCQTNADYSDDAVFKVARRAAVDRGIKWLDQFLLEEGRAGIREGLRHNIDPDGHQASSDTVRTDCCGEAAGAFRFYGFLTKDAGYRSIADNLDSFVLGPMQVKGGLFDGMLRWTDSAWQVCYQDDVARALLPMLYDCLFFGHKDRIDDICRALDFLVKTTAKDGCRVARTDAPTLTADGIRALRETEVGFPSAHYNAYYHAALLFAYRVGGNPEYLDTARRGLETLMRHYPDTRREQSETQEQCRLILPLAALYGSTRDEKHLAMLHRVTDDLAKRKHPLGGYCEWDTGYTATCSRESRGECSLLTENGDPIADMLYSINWLPIGFAYSYFVTNDEKFRKLWRETAEFCLRSQLSSEDPLLDGSWCRAFDMELGEVFGCPHDVGWAACCSESGWTNAEILMGLMMPEILSGTDF